MIYYGKYFLILLLLIILQSSLIFKSLLNLAIVPDFLLVYTFWLVIEGKENLAKVIGIIAGMFLDLINPDKTFINTFSYFFSTMYILSLKAKFIQFNFLLKVLTIFLFSFIVYSLKTGYSYFSSGFFSEKDKAIFIFYTFSNVVMIYVIYYLDTFLIKKDEV